MSWRRNIVAIVVALSLLVVVGPARGGLTRNGDLLSGFFDSGVAKCQVCSECGDVGLSIAVYCGSYESEEACIDSRDRH